MAKSYQLGQAGVDVPPQLQKLEVRALQQQLALPTQAGGSHHTIAYRSSLPDNPK